MKDVKNSKGITLIALVITIIVLLILATVSIANLTGENGLLTKVGDAKTKIQEVESKEEVKLAYNAIQTDGIVKGWDINKKAEELEKELQKQDTTATVTVDGTNLKVNYKGYEIIISSEDTEKFSMETIVASGVNMSRIYVYPKINGMMTFDEWQAKEVLGKTNEELLQMYVDTLNYRAGTNFTLEKFLELSGVSTADELIAPIGKENFKDLMIKEGFANPKGYDEYASDKYVVTINSSSGENTVIELWKNKYTSFDVNESGEYVIKATSQNGETIEKVVSVNVTPIGETLILKDGDYVKYNTGVDTVGNNGEETFRVLYDERAEDGLQIISDNPISEVTLGSNDSFSSAMESYNNLVSILNGKAEQYINPKYAIDARCVGSAPTINSEGKFSKKNNETSYTSSIPDDWVLPEGWKSRDTGCQKGSLEDSSDYMKLILIRNEHVNGKYWILNRKDDSNDSQLYFRCDMMSNSVYCNEWLCVVDSTGRLSYHALTARGSTMYISKNRYRNSGRRWK